MIVPLAAIAIGGKLRGCSRSSPTGPHRSRPALPRRPRCCSSARWRRDRCCCCARERELARLQAGYEASLRLRAAATLAAARLDFREQHRPGRNAVAAAQRRAALGARGRRGAAVRDRRRDPARCPAAAGPAAVAAADRDRARDPGRGLVLVDPLDPPQRRQRDRADRALRGKHRSSGFRLHAGLKAALAQGTVAAVPRRISARASRAKAPKRCASPAILPRRASWPPSERRSPPRCSCSSASACFTCRSPILIASLVLFARMVGPAQLLQHSAQYVAAYRAVVRGGRAAARASSRPAGRRRERDEPLQWSELRARAGELRASARASVCAAVSLVVNRGEWIGVSGASGAGKTTLVDLVAGLLAPQSGRVAGRRRAARRARRSTGWRAGLAYVGQEASVFNDSVRGNLLAEGAEADEPALWAGARAGRPHRARARLRRRARRARRRSRQPAVGRGAAAARDRPRAAASTEPADPRRGDRGARRRRARRRCSSGCARSSRGRRRWSSRIAQSTLAHCDSVVAIRHGKWRNRAIRAI